MLLFGGGGDFEGFECIGVEDLMLVVPIGNSHHRNAGFRVYILAGIAGQAATQIIIEPNFLASVEVAFVGEVDIDLFGEALDILHTPLERRVGAATQRDVILVT